jgi:hypothetical protein
MAITKDESNWPIISLSLGETFDQDTVEEYIGDKVAGGAIGKSTVYCGNLI